MTAPEKRSIAVEWITPTPENIKRSVELAGIDFLQAMIGGDLPRPPINALMGFWLAEVAHGKAVFLGDPSEQLYNPLGTVHGAFTMTLVDSAAGCAVHSALPAGTGYTTLETKVNMVRPVFADTGQLRCEASLVHLGKRVGTAEARVLGGDGKLYAHGTSTCVILPA